MLDHTRRIERLIGQNDVASAGRVHNARVAAEIERARRGETICLSDLMAARDALTVASADRRQSVIAGDR